MIALFEYNNITRYEFNLKKECLKFNRADFNIQKYYQINCICTAAAIRLRQINKYYPNRQQMNEIKNLNEKLHAAR